MPQLIESTNTENNNEICLYEYSPEMYEHTVLFIGCTHGDEPQGEYLINDYMQTPQSNIKNRLLFIPCLNPDGVAKMTRVNANNIDINRNFPTENWELTERDNFYGGSESGSEIETKFIVEVIEKYKPDCILTFHAPYKIVNYDGPAKDVAEKIASIIDYPAQSDIGYPTPGSFGTYCGVERRIPTITLELDETASEKTLKDQCAGIFNYLACEYP